ncbi:MAG TPA: D-cysteine desulfhydrase family protein, partial [Anaerolineales bacterium]|nr:D-cysteine desulfhydrase family protein [Anaerolineales bacterium]
MNLPPKLSFAHLPTPLEPLPRLSKHLGGAEIWIKRDDQTGLAGGGNKTRKLEFLLAEAQANSARTIITCGAAQSNHCRQTAAAAARNGFRCILVLRGDPPSKITGNILLDNLLGAEIVWSRNETRETVMQRVYEEEKANGNDPYLIPLGGSNRIGAAAYAAAAKETREQCDSQPLSSSFLDGGRAGDGGRFTRICFASSSGGTHAGLAVGARAVMPHTEVLGFSVDEPLAVLKSNVANIATETADLLGLPFTFTAADISANADYIGAGYALIGDRERETILLLAQREGILVDPVYTGKAFGGMIDLIRRGVIGKTERVLFWHT